jgi:hypothetical protein
MVVRNVGHGEMTAGMEIFYIVKKVVISLLLALFFFDLSDGVIGDGLHPLSEAPGFYCVKPCHYYHPFLLSIKPEKRGETAFVEIISCEDLEDPRRAKRNKLRGLLRAPPMLTRHLPVKFLHGGWDEKGYRLPGEGYSLDGSPGYTRSRSEIWSRRA